MDFNEGAWLSIKHIWGAVAAVLSAAFSYVFYRHKKNEQRLDRFDDSIQEHDTFIKLFEERLARFGKDLEEIKQDLKKVLFKL